MKGSEQHRLPEKRAETVLLVLLQERLEAVFFGQALKKELAMRLTTKGRFAVTAMIDLGLRQNSGPVTLAAISQRQQISLSYLEQLFGKLRRHELVESTRGPGGGYTLGRKAADINMTDIIV